MKKPKRPRYDGPRPFETDYAGAWKGHAATREGAIMASMGHVVKDGYNKGTITDKRTGEIVARVTIVLPERKHAYVDTPKPMRKIVRRDK